jgi:hypothetical protein
MVGQVNDRDPNPRSGIVNEVVAVFIDIAFFFFLSIIKQDPAIN